ncbi:MAG: hypothetical protein IKA72_01240 [Clostridia bacterium]|nr:hypothetical protein [Clostridia bacterium]
MNKLLKKILFLATVMVVSLTAGIFASCSYGLDQEEKKKQEGYNCTVTYDANGGAFGGSGATRTYALVKENSPAPAPGYVDATTQASVKVPTRRDYQLVGETRPANDNEKNTAAMASKSWFLAETDENGNVVYEGEGENRTPKLLRAEPWDFVKDRVTKDITLVAKWAKVYRYILCVTDGEDENGDPIEKELRSYSVQPGATIADKLYNKKNNELVRRADYIRITASGYTLLDFYMDAELTQPMPLDISHPGTVDGVNDVKIYVKYLKGKFDIISNENVRMLTSASNWYLVEDIDLTNVEWTMQSSFSGQIYGNGFAFKNATITSNAMKPSGAYKQHSIFGTMNGLLDGVTFENFTLKVQTQFGATGIIGEQRLAFLAYQLGTKGEFKNVTVKDCQISRKDSTYYTSTFGDETGLFYVTPATEKAQITIMESNAPVQSIKIVTE